MRSRRPNQPTPFPLRRSGTAGIAERELQNIPLEEKHLSRRSGCGASDEKNCRQPWLCKLCITRGRQTLEGAQNVRKTKLTSSDEVILGELQRNAYKPDAELGELIHRDRTAVSRRRRELEKAGVISGYQAVIDPDKVGLGTTVFTLISLKQHGGGEVKKFGEALSLMPNVIEWSRIGGSWDFLVKFAVKSSRHHDALLYRILDMTNVSRVRGLHVHGKPETKPLPLNGGELVPEDD
jgi:Lrp/AsnC family transcriptional regulator, leucine-responsive regulatory protein